MKEETGTLEPVPTTEEVKDTVAFFLTKMFEEFSDCVPEDAIYPDERTQEFESKLTSLVESWIKEERSNENKG